MHFISLVIIIIVDLVVCHKIGQRLTNNGLRQGSLVVLARHIAIWVLPMKMKGVWKWI